MCCKLTKPTYSSQTSIRFCSAACPVQAAGTAGCAYWGSARPTVVQRVEFCSAKVTAHHWGWRRETGLGSKQPTDHPIQPTTLSLDSRDASIQGTQQSRPASMSPAAAATRHTKMPGTVWLVKSAPNQTGSAACNSTVRPMWGLAAQAAARHGNQGWSLLLSLGRTSTESSHSCLATSNTHQPNCCPKADISQTARGTAMRVRADHTVSQQPSPLSGLERPKMTPSQRQHAGIKVMPTGRSVHAYAGRNSSTLPPTEQCQHHRPQPP